MNADQIDTALAKKFFEEDERLVFWQDEPGEFRSYIEAGLSGPLDGVQVIDIRAKGGLATKIQIDRDDLEGKYLLYADGPAPSIEHDFLVDIRHYSARFQADIVSIWRQELGLSELSIGPHLKKRSAFLKNQQRRKKLSRLVEENDDSATLDLKMMAVLVGSTVSGPFEVLQSLCQGHMTASGEFELSEEPKVMGEFDKYDLRVCFWEVMKHTFGFHQESPSMTGLLRSLFLTELSHALGHEAPSSIEHHVLKSSNGVREAVVFLTRWRDSNTAAASYDAATTAVSQEQNIPDVMASIPPSALWRAVTFLENERCVLASLKDRIVSEKEMIDGEWFEGVVQERRAGHWISGPGKDEPVRRALSRSYDALMAAVRLFKLHAVYRGRFSFDSGPDLLKSYHTELFTFDQEYRSFLTAADEAVGQGWNLLKDLGGDIERLYDQGFLEPLGVEWSRLLDAGFLNHWTDDECPSQSNFYEDTVRPALASSERKRAFVIISDAFRYEAAVELVELFNQQERREAMVSPLLGVVPSFTSLGMAALLPHESLTFNEGGDILADGQSTAGVKGRDQILKKVDGMACQASELIQMTVQDARKFIGDARVVYIYHNVIDARGDSASTENETFTAVRDCISELADISTFCINRLNASTVWITSDHGFLYQSVPPNDTDRSTLSVKPDDALRSKKRYILGRNLGETPEAHHGSVEKTSGASGNMEFWVPRSTTLFHFTGGAKFVHGGAMPQEVMVPLVTVNSLRGDRAEESRVEKVGIQILGSNHKITTPQYRFEVIQTDAVSDRRRPVTLRGAIYEGDKPVSSIETIVFESTSEMLDDRKKHIRFELQAGTYNKKTAYRLILRDVDTEAEIQSAPVMIDRSFDDDF